jgi:hypothetical protein
VEGFVSTADMSVTVCLLLGRWFRRLISVIDIQVGELWCALVMKVVARARSFWGTVRTTPSAVH